MLARNTKSQDHRRLPRGIATLEFVLALPVLLLLMVGITWLGFSVIGQTEALVDARTKAWKKRFDDASKDPLVFPIEVPIANLSVYDRDKDFVTETATKEVKVSPVFDKFPQPKGSHTILAGSWDKTAMPFDRPPDWKLLVRAGVSGSTGTVQQALATLTNVDTLLQGIVSQALASAAQSLVGGGGSAGNGSIENLGSAPPIDENAGKAGEDTLNGEKQQKIKDLTTERDRIQGDIDKAQAELKKLQEQIIPRPQNDPNNPNGNPNNPNGNQNNTDNNQNNNDGKPKPLTKDEKVQLLTTKIKRLESDLRDVQAELNAAQGD